MQPRNQDCGKCTGSDGQGDVACVAIPQCPVAVQQQSRSSLPVYFHRQRGAKPQFDVEPQPDADNAQTDQQLGGYRRQVPVRGG